MDEADILGDRITILANDQVQYTGSGLFLMKKYASEYRLTVEYNEDKKGDDHAAAVLKTLTLLREFILGATVHSSNDFEVILLLPADQRQNSLNLFKKLEINTDLLGINTFGVSATIMDEVCQNAAKKLSPVSDNDLLDDKNHHLEISGINMNLKFSPSNMFKLLKFDILFSFCKSDKSSSQKAICMLSILKGCMMIPVPKKQSSISINLRPYSSSGTVANIHVQNTTTTYFRRNLEDKRIMALDFIMQSRIIISAIYCS
ncbi:Phospholipid-transporting ATPase ABCA3 [Dirofilaria immitis]